MQAAFTIAVPEAPPQLAAALKSNSRPALLAVALAALLAAYAAFKVLAALASAVFGRRPSDLERLQAEAAALDRQRVVAAAVQDCEAEVRRTLMVGSLIRDGRALSGRLHSMVACAVKLWSQGSACRQRAKGVAWSPVAVA